MYQNHRRRLLDELEDGDLALFPGALPARRSGDTDYPFRQDPDLLWLAGEAVPGAVLLLAREVRGLPEAVLFVPPPDPSEELWNGPAPEPGEAAGAAGLEVGAPLDELEDHLARALDRGRRLWYRLGGRLDELVLNLLEHRRRRYRQGEGALALLDPTPVLAELRMHKDEEELACLRRAAAISAEAHLLAMAQCRPGLGEWELQALVEYTFRRHRSVPAYEPIVAGGPRACILHYVRNDRRLREGELLLLDAGAESCGYAADLTRTFPVAGRFQDPARTVYEIVLEAWRAAVEAVTPGARATAPHDAAVAVLAEGLRELDVLREPASRIVEEGLHRPWFPHGTSHWLGLDVHDPGAWRRDGEIRLLEPGMVLTIEPGLYFRENDERVPPPLRGLGVRIEDDVAVTGSGAEILTSATPREVADVEAACAARRAAPPCLDSPILEA